MEQLPLFVVLMNEVSHGGRRAHVVEVPIRPVTDVLFADSVEVTLGRLLHLLDTTMVSGGQLFFAIINTLAELHFLLHHDRLHFLDENLHCLLA